MIDPETSQEALEHLLSVMGTAVELLRANHGDGDALVLDAHRVQLERGREMPGGSIDPDTRERRSRTTGTGSCARSVRYPRRRREHE